MNDYFKWKELDKVEDITSFTPKSVYQSLESLTENWSLNEGKCSYKNEEEMLLAEKYLSKHEYKVEHELINENYTLSFNKIINEEKLEEKKKKKIKTVPALQILPNPEDSVKFFNHVMGADKNCEGENCGASEAEGGLAEGVNPDNPYLKAGIAYLNRYPNAYGYICSYLNPKTHEQVGVAKGFMKEKDLKDYVRQIISLTNTPDISVIYQSNKINYINYLNKDKSLIEDFERITEDDEKWLDEQIEANDYKVVSKQDYGHYGEKFDEHYDVHYQIISNKGNKTEADLEIDAEWLNGLLDDFEDRTGSPCTYNMGLQTDGFISAGFDCRAIYYKPGEDVVWHKPTHLRFKNGKPADEATKAQLNSINDKMGIDNIEDFIPTDKPIKESKRDIYDEMKDEYFRALNRAEENGSVYFTATNEDDPNVDSDAVIYEEFDTFEDAKKFAEENKIDKIKVSSFGFEGPDGYDNGDYTEYDEQWLDLNKKLVEELNNFGNPFIGSDYDFYIVEDEEGNGLGELGEFYSDPDKWTRFEYKDEAEAALVDFPGCSIRGINEEDLEEDYNLTEDIEQLSLEIARLKPEDLKELSTHNGRMTKYELECLAELANLKEFDAGNILNILSKYRGGIGYDLEDTIKSLLPKEYIEEDLDVGEVEKELEKVFASNHHATKLDYYKALLDKGFKGKKIEKLINHFIDDKSLYQYDDRILFRDKAVENAELALYKASTPYALIVAWNKIQSLRELGKIDKETLDRLTQLYNEKDKKIMLGENIDKDIEKHDELNESYYPSSYGIENCYFKDLSEEELKELLDMSEEELKDVAEDYCSFNYKNKDESKVDNKIKKDFDSGKVAFAYKVNFFYLHSDKSGGENWESDSVQINPNFRQLAQKWLDSDKLYSSSKDNLGETDSYTFKNKNNNLECTIKKGDYVYWMWDFKNPSYKKDFRFSDEFNNVSIENPEQITSLDVKRWDVKLNPTYRSVDRFDSVLKPNLVGTEGNNDGVNAFLVSDHLLSDNELEKELIKIYGDGKLYNKGNKVYDDKKIFRRKNNESLSEDIEKHDTLNPVLFDGEELKPEVKETIEKIANEFISELNEDGINFTLKDIILLGSNVSYNYTKDSDLDIHLIADSNSLECPTPLLDKLYGAYRSIFNKNYDITIKGIPVEIYVELDEPRAKSNGIYSLNSGWIKKPEQTSIPDLDEEAFEKLFTEWEDKYFEVIK